MVYVDIGRLTAGDMLVRRRRPSGDVSLYVVLGIRPLGLEMYAYSIVDVTNGVASTYTPYQLASLNWERIA